MGRSEESRDRMLETNVRQHEYYESRFEAGGSSSAERAANRPTRMWTSLRRRIMRLRTKAGGDDELLGVHRSWLGNIASARVLDLGCFSGNELSLWIASHAQEYVGIDLSEQAIAKLQADLDAKQLTSASAIAMDFLANDWPDGHFDCVYAYSVLHHFADLDTALAELRRLVKPGGIVVSMDPIATEPFNRLARALFRPVQTDRDWEFPFSHKTFDVLRRYFIIQRMRGVQGAVKLSYPLLLIPAAENLGLKLAARLLALDARHVVLRMPLIGPWHVAMKLERPRDS